MNTILLQLTENDKRLIFAVLLVIILVLVIAGLLGKLVLAIMNYQAHKLDNSVKDVVYYRAQVCPKKRQFRKYARAKNNQLFFKKVWIPFLLMVIAAIFLYVAETTYGRSWNYDPFNHKDGFGTLLFIWDFEGVELSDTFIGIKVWTKWPSLLEDYGTPQLVAEAWASYVFVPFAIAGLGLYLISIQGWIARWLRIGKIINKYYNTNLDDNIGSAPTSPTDTPDLRV